MSKKEAWAVSPSGSRKLDFSEADSERQLEEWIENEPSLINPDLVIVGRQVSLESGEVDLLGLDRQGHWAVIEIKRRDLPRDALTQAWDYAACLMNTPFEKLASKANSYLISKGNKAKFEEIFRDRTGQSEHSPKYREVELYLVGTGRDPGLERMTDLLKRRGNIPAQVIQFEIFDLGKGERLLIRDVKEEDRPNLDPIRKRNEVLEKAKKAGLGAAFQKLLAAGAKHGFYARPYSFSIMFAPPKNKTRCLYVAWTTRPLAPGVPRFYVASDAFSEFYPVTKESARKILGSPGYIRDIDEFVKNLDKLFAITHEENRATEG